jgi:hypothetical protein
MYNKPQLFAWLKLPAPCKTPIVLPDGGVHPIAPGVPPSTEESENTLPSVFADRIVTVWELVFWADNTYVILPPFVRS